MSIVISSDFAYVALAASSTVFLYTMLGNSVLKARKKYNVPYPDMGSGIYASKLNEKDWVAFNSVMRSHLNLSEQLPTYLTLLFSSGLYYPRAAAALGAFYTLGRFLYARGYVNKGPDGRFNGAMMSMFSILGLLGMTVWGSLKTLAII
jgi:glutathione S-transferase